MKKTIVISLGGSVIVPKEIDTDFLKEFKELITSYLDRYRFILVTGGGNTCRDYQQAAKSISEIDSETLESYAIKKAP